LKGIHIFFISLFLTLCVGGYFLFKHWDPSKGIDVWELVPESAILVFESTRTVENWNEIQGKAVWQNLEQIPYYAAIRSKIELLDSLSGNDGNLHRLLQSKPFLFSVHKVSSRALDYVFFIPLDNLNDPDLLEVLVSQYRDRDDFKFQTRTYQDITIHEAVNQEYEEIFSYLIYQNHFIGSFTPFLIEDVIRNVTGQNNNSFTMIDPGMFEVAKLDNDQGNIYINIPKVPELLTSFTNEQMSPGLAGLGNLARSTFLDLKVSDDRVMFNGFTLTDHQDYPYLESVGGFQGSAIGFRSILSNEVAVLYHLTFNDAPRWHEQLRSYWVHHDDQQLDSWNRLKNELNWDPIELISQQRNEIGLAVVGTLEDEEPDKLLYLYCDNLGQGLEKLDQAAKAAADLTGTDAYVEPFGSKQITGINLSQFPEKIWGKLFTGFDQCFYMPVNDYIVLSSSISGLKNLERAVDGEETWGKSIVRSEFLDHALQEANMSLYVNLPRYWNVLSRNLSGDWKDFIDLHRSILEKFELLTFQFSDIGDKFYTSGVLTYNDKVANQQSLPRFSSHQQILTRSPIISKPFVVTNHNNGSKEVLLQDSLRDLYLIGSQGRTLWQGPLGSSICGKVTQIDYYANNKLQYLLATEKQIHIIDRNGNSVEGYPVAVPTNSKLRNIGVIDYDNSKRYRFVASDESGQIFMYDKQGGLLEGWNPKVLHDQLLFAPQHIRVRDKDCIIAVQENGQVHIMNRRGDSYPGFPLDLTGSIEGPLFISPGTDFGTTQFTALTRDGLIIKFDLNGKVTDRQQLLKPTSDTYFELCMDPLERHYVIKRQNANRLGILNRQGEVLFEKDYLSTANLIVQYYLLNNSHSVYAVTDPVQQFTYFYRQDGNLINLSPIESTTEIAMLYYENQRQHQIYSVYDNKFALLSF